MELNKAGLLLSQASRIGDSRSALEPIMTAQVACYRVPLRYVTLRYVPLRSVLFAGSLNLQASLLLSSQLSSQLSGQLSG